MRYAQPMQQQRMPAVPAPVRHKSPPKAGSGLGVRSLSRYHGRHTFISHALTGGRTLAQVWTAAGHTNLAESARNVFDRYAASSLH